MTPSLPLCRILVGRASPAREVPAAAEPQGKCSADLEVGTGTCHGHPAREGAWPRQPWHIGVAPTLRSAHAGLKPGATMSADLKVSATTAMLKCLREKQKSMTLQWSVHGENGVSRLRLEGIGRLAQRAILSLNIHSKSPNSKNIKNEECSNQCIENKRQKNATVGYPFDSGNHYMLGPGSAGPCDQCLQIGQAGACIGPAKQHRSERLSKGFSCPGPYRTPFWAKQGASGGPGAGFDHLDPQRIGVT